jgi:hypothetical protein
MASEGYFGLCPVCKKNGWLSEYWEESLVYLKATSGALVHRRECVFILAR